MKSGLPVRVHPANLGWMDAFLAHLPKLKAAAADVISESTELGVTEERSYIIADAFIQSIYDALLHGRAEGEVNHRLLNDLRTIENEAFDDVANHIARVNRELPFLILDHWDSDLDSCKLLLAKLRPLLNQSASLNPASNRAPVLNQVHRDCGQCFVLIYRKDLAIVAASPSIDRISQYPVNTLIGKSCVDIFSQEVSTASIVNDVIKFANYGDVCHGRLIPIKCKRNTVCWCVWTSHHLANYAGGPATMTVGVDVTSVLGVNGFPDLNYLTARELANSSPNIIIKFDPTTGRSWYLNDRILCELGLAKRDIDAAADVLYDRCHPDDQKLLERARARYVDLALGEVVETEFRVLHRDGEWVWLLSRDVAFTDNFFARSILRTVYDISARKRHEERLMRSEAQYRRLFDEDLTGDFVATRTGELVLCNPSFARMLGFESVEEALLAKDFRLFSTPDEMALLEHALQNQAQALEPGAGIHERTIQRQDGKQITVIENLVGFVGTDDEESRVQGFLLDITERVQLQEKLLQMERLAAIGQMAAGIAHESRNALQLIQASAEMLALEIANQPELLEILKDIQQAEDTLQRLHEEIRQYAAPMKLRRQRCSLATIWHEAWNQLMTKCDNRSVRLVDPMISATVELQVDRTRMLQVFRNIFSNSLDAGSDLVEIGINRKHASLVGKPAFCFTITDNGPGLNDEQRVKMFEPFYTTKCEGTGLGMAIARRIIEAHGGTIAINELKKVGTELILTLPKDDQ